MTQPTHHPRKKLQRARRDIVEIATEWLRDNLNEDGAAAAEAWEAIEQRIDIEIIDAVRRATNNHDEDLPPAA
jgi:hypothetical protein